MVIKKKLEREETIDQNMRNKIIEKGASVAADQDLKEWINISLRITRELIGTIDSGLNTRVGISRNAWILEAIQEKIRREKGFHSEH
jgi:hypothetical protein